MQKNELFRRRQRSILKNLDFRRRKRRGTFGFSPVGGDPSRPGQKPGWNRFFSFNW
jgi:hypothetical protein